MRWENLFADLEAELAAEEQAELRSEVADRIRFEWGRFRLVDRLRPVIESPRPLRVSPQGQSPVLGTLRGLGSDWLLLEQAGEEFVVPLAAVQWVEGTRDASAEPGREGAINERFGLRLVLRRITRDRSPVSIALTSGASLAGRLARVGADHVELDVTSGQQPPAGTRILVPFAAIAFVRRR